MKKFELAFVNIPEPRMDRSTLKFLHYGGENNMIAYFHLMNP